ncbi:uncharacterized protein DS421_4g132730 [Arachis hypogaea]|nr:uncharacterized protein DS421_4g132730 [Arachis hypogaea]
MKFWTASGLYYEPSKGTKGEHSVYPSMISFFCEKDRIRCACLSLPFCLQTSFTFGVMLRMGDESIRVEDAALSGDGKVAKDGQAKQQSKKRHE